MHAREPGRARRQQGYVGISPRLYELFFILLGLSLNSLVHISRNNQLFNYYYNWPPEDPTASQSITTSLTTVIQPSETPNATSSAAATSSE